MVGKSSDYETPQDLFDKLSRQFAFELDVAAAPTNTKCERFYTEADNGLVQPWATVNWCNPPYGRGIEKWVKKALEEVRNHNTTVMLLPARVDTRWFHDLVLPNMDAGVITCTFIKGRLKFGGAKHPAPFPCMILAFRTYGAGLVTGV